MDKVTWYLTYFGVVSCVVAVPLIQEPPPVLPLLPLQHLPLPKRADPITGIGFPFLGFAI